MVAILLIDKKKYIKLGKIESTIGMSEQSASSQVLVNIYTKELKKGILHWYSIYIWFSLNMLNMQCIYFTHYMGPLKCL